MFEPGPGVEPELTFVLSAGQGLMVTGWVGLELAAILTRLRATTRFESRILVALLPNSSPFLFILPPTPTLEPSHRSHNSRCL